MKKAVVCATLSSLFISGLAWADISLYGKAHVAVEYEEIDGSDESKTDLVSNASRFGIEGETEINHGLTALFKYEVGVDVDGTDGDDHLSPRNQYAGLKGSFGKLIAGRHDTPMKTLEGKIDLFGDTYADIGEVLDHYVDTQERENRFVGYYSPKLSGLQFQIATMPGKGDEAELGDAVSTALVYGDPEMKKSNYYLGIAYDNEVDGAETQAFRLAGSVKLGDLGLGAIVENADDGSDDHMRYIASAFYKMGDGKLEVQYANADELGEHGESDQATIGWEHKLGGGASAYIAYSKRELEDVESDHASVGFIYKF